MADTQNSNMVDDAHPADGSLDDATTQGVATLSGEGGGGSAEIDALFEGEDDDWPTAATSRGLRVPWPVAGLTVLLMVFSGLWAGAYLQRHSSSSSFSASPFGGSFPFSGSAGAGVPTGGGPGASSAAAGTVTDIIGHTLYVTNSSGQLVAVTVGSNTTVNRNAKSSLSALRPGDTVTVQGTKAKNGTVSATSISSTQAGVTSSGGFPGFGQTGQSPTG
ncbi:MAG: hypothetical protein HIU84_09235 [Acidobacteria bacterium]|nr:hypothetical protein [Acidobacteriota bacterium]